VCSDARIILGAVAAGPVRAEKAEISIKDKVLDEPTAEAAANAAIDDTVPLSMNKYKIEITKVLVKRALLA
jgi:xanthine dehydrogenase YagS FAD-binding subunit